MNSFQKKVVVGLSGGVDSSVAAYLLKKEGFDVIGVFMKNWEEDDTDDYCAAKKDMADAQSVAEQLNIPFKQINFSAEYWEHVFEYFLHEYRSGRTPNPDIICNKEIKFKAFLDYALILGADYISTGHYVRKITADDQNHSKINTKKHYHLLRGLDSTKDQSYFLYTLTQSQLSRSLFPLGDLEKKTVRKIADEQGFVTARKKDSTGICFIGERKFNDFLKKYIPAQPGTIENTKGDVLGQHLGLMFYTLGQRKGIGLGGLKISENDAPWYVVEKDLKRNVLQVAQGHNHPHLLSQGLIASQLHWSLPETIKDTFICTAKSRYRQEDFSCSVKRLSEQHWQVMFDQKQRAITPGQSIVFYQKEHCLGGGIIESKIP
jgi:tRNA-specific 2-thiouridylase